MSPSRKALLAFANNIAEMTRDGELVDGEEFVMENDDAVETVNGLIWEARKLLDQLSTCDDCGQEVDEIVGCPDGSEICWDCFDAGRH